MKLTEQEIEERFEEILQQAPVDAFGKLIREMASNGLSIDQKEFMIDRGGSSDITSQKITIINKQFYLNNKEIYESKATFSNYPMYFIHFWILIDEIKSYFVNQATNSVNLKEKLELSDSYIESIQNVGTSIEKFESQVSPEELNMIEFLRNNSCHLTTSKYHMQWNAKNKSFAKEIYGIYRGDVRAIISNELKKHDENIEKVAKHLAHKTYPKLQIMFDSIEVWNKENQTIKSK